MWHITRIRCSHNISSLLDAVVCKWKLIDHRSASCPNIIFLLLLFYICSVFSRLRLQGTVWFSTLETFFLVQYSLILTLWIGFRSSVHFTPTPSGVFDGESLMILSSFWIHLIRLTRCIFATIIIWCRCLDKSPPRQICGYTNLVAHKNAENTLDRYARQSLEGLWLAVHRASMWTGNNVNRQDACLICWQASFRLDDDRGTLSRAIADIWETGCDTWRRRRLINSFNRK